MIKKITVVIIILILILNTLNVNSKTIPDEAIRIRIVANSNSTEDQEIKNIVRKKVQKELSNMLKDAKTLVESRNIIKNNMDKINNLVDETLKNEKYNLGYTLNYGYNYFPKKEFNGETYEEGQYESLLISLGSGKGDNWWCVLFPPLCIIEAEENQKVEYNSFFIELIKNLTK